jgi:hypothetical protein
MITVTVHTYDRYGELAWITGPFALSVTSVNAVVESKIAKGYTPTSENQVYRATVYFLDVHTYEEIKL